MRNAPFALLALLSLAACGADGLPKPPAADSAAPGITLSGSATMGVARGGG